MKILKLIWAMLLAAALAACGGGGSITYYSVGGTVSGLIPAVDGAVVLSYDYASGTEELTLTNNAAFTFKTKIVSGGHATVSVKTHPGNQLCSVSNGAVTNISSNVTNVTVTCATAGWQVTTGIAALDLNQIVEWTENPAYNAQRALVATPRQVVYTGNRLFTIYNSSNNAATSFNLINLSGVDANNFLNDQLTSEADSVFASNQNRNYYTKAGNIYSSASSSTPFSTANLNSPKGMVADASGNLYVSDAGNSVIKKIDTSGNMSIYVGLAGQSGDNDGDRNTAKFTYPWALAIDTNGNLYVADYFAHTIRKVTPDRVVSTLAGKSGVRGALNGTGDAARFYGPRGVATDSSGNVYVADTYNNQIRKVTPDGVVTTVAGQAGMGYADGVAANAKFNAPTGIAVDSSGTIYVGDYANNAVRRIKYQLIP